jgi:hypothetical protein
LFRGEVSEVSSCPSGGVVRRRVLTLFATSKKSLQEDFSERMQQMQMHKIPFPNARIQNMQHSK